MAGSCPILVARPGGTANPDCFRDQPRTGRSGSGQSLAGRRTAPRFHGQPHRLRPDDRRLGRQHRHDAAVHFARRRHQPDERQRRDGGHPRRLARAARGGQVAGRPRRADQCAAAPVVAAALCGFRRAARGGRLPDGAGRRYQRPEHQRLQRADDGDLRGARGTGAPADREGRRARVQERLGRWRAGVGDALQPGEHRPDDHQSGRVQHRDEPAEGKLGRADPFAAHVEGTRGTHGDARETGRARRVDRSHRQADQRRARPRHARRNRPPGNACPRRDHGNHGQPQGAQGAVGQDHLRRQGQGCAARKSRLQAPRPRRRPKRTSCPAGGRALQAGTAAR